MEDFDCPFTKELTLRLYAVTKSEVKPCKLPCPVNNEICYRWDICFMAKHYKVGDRVVPE